MGKRKVVGVGINDIGTSHVYMDGEMTRCPYYSVWKRMLVRCYDPKYNRRSAYSEVTVCDDWLVFSNFRDWMEDKEWEGNHLDKDLKVYGNRVYSPDTCLFVPPEINSFLTYNNTRNKSGYIGASYQKDCGKYIATCHNPFTGKNKTLGRRKDPLEAHRLWQLAKIAYAKELAKIHSDNTEVAEGLLAFAEVLQGHYDNLEVTK